MNTSIYRILADEIYLTTDAQLNLNKENNHYIYKATHNITEVNQTLFKENTKYDTVVIPPKVERIQFRNMQQQQTIIETLIITGTSFIQGLSTLENAKVENVYFTSKECARQCINSISKGINVYVILKLDENGKILRTPQRRRSEW